MRFTVLRSLAIALSLSLASCGGCGNNADTTGAGGGGAATIGATSTGAGMCTKGAAPMICDGVCVDTSADPNNCGACNAKCQPGAACCTNVCVVTASCAFAPTSVTPQKGFLNGGDYVTIKGAGFAAPVEVFFGDGRAPAVVLDASTILALTPPGVVGSVDVKVTMGNQSATLSAGFAYTLGGLNIPWQQKPMMSVRGEDPGVGVMQDARVLVAGGTVVPDSTADALDTAEIYTRMTDVVTPAGNAMSTKRWQNSAVPLMSGKVLVVGGACHVDLTKCIGDPTLADLFDPTTNMFTPTKGKLNAPRAYTRAVLLGDGRVLISSGNDPSLEVYDPATDMFTLVPSMQLHMFGFMVRLRDGRALIGGGDGSVTAAEVFDPATNMLTSVGPMMQGRSMLTAQTLPDSHVLVIGGASVSAGSIIDPLDTMELFDPKTSTFALAPYKLSIGRTWHASALVRDGTVLVMGGYTVSKQCDSSVPSVDQVDPLNSAVKAFANLPNANTEWVAVTLLDGSVLGVGGGACGTNMALPDLDFLPGTSTPN